MGSDTVLIPVVLVSGVPTTSSELVSPYVWSCVMGVIGLGIGWP